MKFTCKCSIVEIYNETITDLLNPDSGNLPLRESKKDGVYIEGVSERRVDNGKVNLQIQKKHKILINAD